MKLKAKKGSIVVIKAPSTESPACAVEELYGHLGEVVEIKRPGWPYRYMVKHRAENHTAMPLRRTEFEVLS